MKKKIISVVLSSFLIFSNVSSSFANPVVVAPTISYELLMGLMGLGVAFGVALPQTDEEYYDYTNALKSHLRLVDEEYLKELDEHFKNNNNNDKKFQVPYVPGVLEKLFDSLGKEVSSPSTRVYSGTLGNIPIFETTKGINGNAIKIPLGETVGYSYVNSKGNSCVGSIRYYKEGRNTYIQRKFETSDGKSRELTSSVSIASNKTLVFCLVGNLSSYIYPYIGTITDGVFSGGVFSDFIYGNNITEEDYYIKYNNNETVEGVIRDKTEIEYSPNTPEIDYDNNTIKIPEVPNISIPESGKLPNTPPFEVSEPITNPNPNPNPNPDNGEGSGEGSGEGNFPSFPNMGDSLDFSPLYLSNITEKFPFSLPWDFKRIIDMFDVEPVAPKFEVPLVTETIEIDFSYFEDWAMIIRFFIIIIFTSTLIFISTKLKG